MDHNKFILRVTAGPEYKDQKDVSVNTSNPFTISTPHLDATIHVRVKDFRGLPKSLPSDSAYFSHPLHHTDRYSIEFRFTPKDGSINGNDLVFGNDFDHPIRDRLPPMFGKIFNYVKSWIDPGLEGDPESDKPYLYGPLLSSVNVLRIGAKGDSQSNQQKKDDSEEDDEVVEEGADDSSAEEIRSHLSIPGDSKARMKFFLDESNRKKFEFEQGREYCCDFFNPYLDFNEFALRLPLGLSMSIIRHWDGQPLRYVLRNRATGDLLFVVSFNLVPTDEEAKKAAEEHASVPIAAVPGEENEEGKEREKSEENASGYVDEGVD